MSEQQEGAGDRAKLEQATKALVTLQQMTGSNNKDNPWLGVTAAVALLQLDFRAFRETALEVETALRRERDEAREALPVARVEAAEAAIDEERARIRAEEVAPLLEACKKLLDAYGEAHALYDLGDCEGSILARTAITAAEERAK